MVSEKYIVGVAERYLNAWNYGMEDPNWESKYNLILIQLKDIQPEDR